MKNLKKEKKLKSFMAERCDLIRKIVEALKETDQRARQEERESCIKIINNLGYWIKWKGENWVKRNLDKPDEIVEAIRKEARDE